ncbi:MAG TPA: SDR family NAD(P)-dependent oxidoreductase [Gemmataceae bacterium]|nr:SDR family NAD(P)-dependent oxidoreductase [Gemmataceae bacterium]
MRRDLSGKRAILTGASGGIGRALAQSLSRAGVRVVLAGRNVGALKELAADLPDAVVEPADVTNAQDRKRLVEAAVRQLGGLDLLVNAAGIGSFGHFAGSSEVVLRRVMEVNFFAAAELTRTALPHLMNGIQPAVVNVTSMTGRRGMPAWSEYSASKFALVGLGEALRAELARFGVDVVTIVPGLTNTGFGNSLLRNEGKMRIPFSRGMSPASVADRVVLAIRKNRREVWLGRETKLVLWFNKFFPKLQTWIITKKVKRLYHKP